jgi:hypothetical protein
LRSGGNEGGDGGSGGVFRGTVLHLLEGLKRILHVKSGKGVEFFGVVGV